MKKPTAPFVFAGWAALAVFAITYFVALWRMGIPVVENYFYVTIMLFGLAGVVVLTKAVRDKEDGIPVTGAFVGIAWASVLAPLAIMSLYLLNASALDELQRGMLFLTFIASLFAGVVVQKNYRDMMDWRSQNPNAAGTFDRFKPETGVSDGHQ